MNITLPKQNCPLCDRLVEFRGTHLGTRKKVNCPHCGIYEISTVAEQEVTKLSKQQREMLSKESMQASKNTILSIWINLNTKEIKREYAPDETSF